MVWSGNGVGDDSGVYSSVCDMRLLRSENLAPVNTVPDAQTTVADTPLVLSTANGNAIQITDPDLYPSTYQVTLSTDHGTLTLADTDGLTFTAGGNGTSTMTFTGMPTDINAALDGLQFLPTLDFTGTANIQITANNLASVYLGGARIDSDTVAVNVLSPAPIAAESLVNTSTDGVQQTATAMPSRSPRMPTATTWSFGQARTKTAAGTFTASATARTVPPWETSFKSIL